LMKQFSLIEIVSTATVLLAMVVESSRVFHSVDSATLQVAHRCTPAPYGMLAVPAALPTVATSPSDDVIAGAANSGKNELSSEAKTDK